MKFQMEKAEIFVPDGSSPEAALARTTHLGIGAHQDDLEFMAFHGIQECHESDALWFTGITLTDGAGSARSGAYADFSDDQMRELRREEQREAARIGRYSCQIQLQYPSASLKDPADQRPVQELIPILGATTPRFLYLHSPADKHDTHVASFLRALSALRSIEPPLALEAAYGCEIWRDLDWMPDEEKIALPVDQNDALAEALARVFRSQIEGGKRYDLAIQGRRVANATFHASHEVDQTRALSLAMDLIPLLDDRSLPVAEFLAALMARMQRDVIGRLARLGAPSDAS